MVGEFAPSMSDIGFSESRKEPKDRVVEDSEHLRRMSHSYLSMIFLQGDIASMMQSIFNGTITNDKICMSRVRQMQWKPARAKRRDEIQYPSEGNETERFPQEDTH